jgi:hypothetical protein
MAQDHPETDYRPDFVRLGVEQVRADVLHRRYEPEKLAAARQWLECEDARRWLAGRSDVPRRPRPEWLKRWAGYIAAAIGLAYDTARLVRILRYGM